MFSQVTRSHEGQSLEARKMGRPILEGQTERMADWIFGHRKGRPVGRRAEDGEEWKGKNLLDSELPPRNFRPGGGVGKRKSSPCGRATQ